MVLVKKQIFDHLNVSMSTTVGDTTPMSLDGMCVFARRTFSIHLIMALSRVVFELSAKMFVKKIGSPGKNLDCVFSRFGAIWGWS